MTGEKQKQGQNEDGQDSGDRGTIDYLDRDAEMLAKELAGVAKEYIPIIKKRVQEGRLSKEDIRKLLSGSFGGAELSDDELLEVGKQMRGGGASWGFKPLTPEEIQSLEKELDEEEERVLGERAGSQTVYYAPRASHLVGEITDEEVMEFLRKRYEGVEIAKTETDEAGTRRCFRAREGGRMLFIKTDKPKSQVTNPNAMRNLDKKYDTAHDAKISSELPLDEAIINHISPVIRTHKYGGAVVISVEPNFENSTSLKRRVNGTKNEDGTLEEPGRVLNYDEFVNVFSDILKAERYLASKGLLNRDLGAGNILIRQNPNGKTSSKKNLAARVWEKTEKFLFEPKKSIPLEARITDLANAGHESEIREAGENPQPTLGARGIADPLVFSRKMKYDGGSEVYAIAAEMVYALNGNSPDGNPDMYRDYTADSTFDPKKHEKMVEKAIARLPKYARRRKLVKLLRKALSCDVKERYKTVGDFAEAFEKATKPTLRDKINKKPLLYGLVGAAMLGTLISPILIMYEDDKKTRALEKKIEELKHSAPDKNYRGGKENDRK
ncbi:MAG: hypothetical protein MUF61_01630 [archaeon]|nr:hypothetical protein [archaeon]